MSEISLAFEALPLVTERWHDLEILFEQPGAPDDCWCMWWRIQKKQFIAQSGQGNKDAMKALVDSGVVPGLIGYIDGQPAGWISVAPREDFPRMKRSKILKAVDDQPVWSIVCFFIDKAFRKQGVSLLLLRAAVDYAMKNGATIVEGYPIDFRDHSCSDDDAYYGAQSIYEKAGFEEVVRRSPTRSVMRFFVKN